MAGSLHPRTRTRVNSSVVLFRAWTAKHRERVEAEDRLALALESDSPLAPAMGDEVASLQRQDDALQAAALAAFRAELRARGIRE